jgi:hypothetical protein
MIKAIKFSFIDHGGTITSGVKDKVVQNVR